MRSFPLYVDSDWSLIFDVAVVVVSTLVCGRVDVTVPLDMAAGAGTGGSSAIHIIDKYRPNTTRQNTSTL